MFRRGDKVEWWSHSSKLSSAVFVEYDQDFPTKMCILGVRIGVKGNQMTHTFRWPLSQVAMRGEGRTIDSRTTKRRGA
jgi:hypothetical protein